MDGLKYEPNVNVMLYRVCIYTYVYIHIYIYHRGSGKDNGRYYLGFRGIHPQNGESHGTKSGQLNESHGYISDF